MREYGALPEAASSGNWNDRAIVRGPLVGPVHVARRCARNPVALQILVHEIAGHQRLAQVGEEHAHVGRVRREIALEAAFHRAGANHRAQGGKMAGVCRTEHSCTPLCRCHRLADRQPQGKF